MYNLDIRWIITPQEQQFAATYHYKFKAKSLKRFNSIVSAQIVFRLLLRHERTQIGCGVRIPECSIYFTTLKVLKIVWRFHTPRCLPTGKQNRFLMTPLGQINVLHCPITVLHLSSFFSREKWVLYCKRKNRKEFSKTAFGRAVYSVISNSASDYWNIHMMK